MASDSLKLLPNDTSISLKTQLLSGKDKEIQLPPTLKSFYINIHWKTDGKKSKLRLEFIFHFEEEKKEKTT